MVEYNVIPCSFYPGDMDEFSLMVHSNGEVGVEEIEEDEPKSIVSEWKGTTAGFFFFILFIQLTFIIIPH